MKLLLFSDLHADVAAAERLVRMSGGADVLVGAGDFAVVRRNIDACIRVLSAVALPAILVPGNAESAEELAAACAGWPEARVLHGSGTVIDGVPFYGLGGGVPVTPFGDWSYDFTEEQAQALLAGCPAGAVLVSHSPPHGATDQDSHGHSRGSTAVREVVLACRPRLVVCGHIHASAGQRAMLGTSPVVNAGPGGVLWDLTG